MQRAVLLARYSGKIANNQALKHSSTVGLD